jgi:hypothetical protein
MREKPVVPVVVDTHTTKLKKLDLLKIQTSQRMQSMGYRRADRHSPVNILIGHHGLVKQSQAERNRAIHSPELIDGSIRFLSDMIALADDKIRRTAETPVCYGTMAEIRSVSTRGYMTTNPMAPHAARLLALLESLEVDGHDMAGCKMELERLLRAAAGPVSMFR